MKFWISSITLTPVLFILLIYLVKEYKRFKGIKEINKAKIISMHDYNHLNLKEVKVDYKIPRGQKAYLVIGLKQTYKAQAQRMYTGHTAGGIKFPFFNLSIQKKKFYQQGAFLAHGSSKLTVTNRLIRIQGDPFKWTYNLKDIEQLKLIDNNKTVQLSMAKAAWPAKFVFYSAKEAELFMNTVWTCYHGVRNEAS